jgi:adenylate cyclase
MREGSRRVAKEAPMAMAIDPVCGMRIDSEDAAAFAAYEGKTYYLCSQACFDAFVADPSLTPHDAASDLDRDRLTEDELADRSGASVEHIRGLVGLGILEPDEGTFRRRDVMRTRVVAQLEAKGMDAEALASAAASGDLTLGYLESAGRRFPRSDQTFTRLSDEIGIPLRTLQMLYVAFGLPRPHPDEHVREEDLPVLKSIPVLFGAGVGEGDVLRAVRVWGDSARRVAQFVSHYFHHTIEEPFRRRGRRDNEAFEAAIREVGFRMGHSGEQLLGWLYRRHSEAFFTEHQFQHVETALEEAGIRQRSPSSVEAAAFADLSGYTRLTEDAGDEVAARVSLKLAQMVNEIAARHHGEVVKMLGDGVHFHFRDPGDAVRASLEIVETVRSRGLPPAHIGVNAGPMIYDEGDYFGRTVNIAARIASQAAADQVLVGEDLARSVEPREFRVIEVGQFDLKGITQPVTIYEAVRAEAASRIDHGAELP